MKPLPKVKKLFCGGMLFCLSFLFFMSCHKGSESQMEQVAQDFSSAYFNWRFPAAAQYVTTESRRWLIYVASQVNQEDVDSLRTMQEGATCHTGDIHYNDDGASATIKVTVKNFMPMDSIGTRPRLCKQGEYAIPLSYDGHEWKVDLTAPLRGINEDK